MDKFLNIMRLNPDEDDYDEVDYYDEPEVEQAPPKKSSKVKEFDDYDDSRSYKKSYQQKVTPIRQASSRKASVGNGVEVRVIKPVSVEDGREITETLLDNQTVVLNLEGLDMDIAQRILDFTSGSCYALNGKLQKVSHYIFIVTPQSVDTTGDFQDIFGGFDASME